jgi:hypothetical protein
MTKLSDPIIVCAACRFCGDIIIAAPRHYDMTMRNIVKFIETEDNPYSSANVEQGFIDQHGVFYTREEAWVIAVKNNQIHRNIETSTVGKLFSEHLY